MNRWCLVALGFWVGLASAQDDRLELARKLSAAGQHVQAISEYQKALEKSPGQAPLWIELADERMAANQSTSAVSDYSRAVRLEPTNLRAQKGLATAAEKSGNQQRALLEWRRFAQLATGPDQAEAEKHIDQILVSLGQAPSTKSVDTVKATATVARKPIPSSNPAKVKAEASAPADLKKAVEAWKEGHRDKALELLRGIIKKKPTTEAYYYAGVMRFEAKKLDMAEFNLKKALADKDLGGSAWYWLGRVQEARHKPKDAKASFKKSLELSPKGEFATEAKAHFEPEPAKPAHDTAHVIAATKEPAKPEIAPPLLPDSLRSLYSWMVPELKIPPGDGSAAGKLLDDAAKQIANKQNDLALSTLEQLKLKESASPAAELVGLASAVAYNAMGLSSNGLAHVEGFLKDNPTHPQADYAKFVLGISLLRSGKADSASKVIGPLPVAPKGALWTEAARQSALGEALRLSGKPSEALAALRLAFQAETDTKSRRSIALRMAREATKANTAEQALVPLLTVRKACDKSNSCLQVEVTEADILWSAGKFKDAAPLYAEIVKNWPHSSESQWAMYQTGCGFQKLDSADQATSSWKQLIERYPGSYWAGQAKLRLEDAVWRTRYKAGK